MRKKKHPEHVNHERWLVSFADFMTLLFAFFVVMFSVSQVDSQKVGRFTQSFQAAIGIELVPGGQGIMPSEGAGMFPGDKPPEEVPEEGGKGKGKGKGKGGTKDELKALAEALEAHAKVRKELAGLKIVRRGNELVLRLDETILFTSGDDQISDDARLVLKAIGEELKDRPVLVRVEGHTDDQPISTGRFRSNWDLSTARATSVVTTLAALADVKPNRLAAMGYAEYQPLGDNSTKEGRSQNRRVDFVLTVEVPQPVP